MTTDHEREVRIPEKLCGIIGHPLGHTMSPLLHNGAFADADLPYAYMAWPVEPRDLERFMSCVRALPLHGLSVTIPHKVAVMEHCDEVSQRADSVGAVNTLYWREGRLVGENTDVTGFTAPLRGREKPCPSALVLGAGGAARAVLAGLKEIGVEALWIANRSRERAEALAAQFHCQVLDWERRDEWLGDLLVNTTALGMTGAHETVSPWPRTAVTNANLVYDIVYNPLETRLIRDAREAGIEVVTGEAMFLGQAAEQFRLWTGREMDMKKARERFSRAMNGR